MISEDSPNSYLSLFPFSRKGLDKWIYRLSSLIRCTLGNSISKESQSLSWSILKSTTACSGIVVSENSSKTKYRPWIWRKKTSLGASTWWISQEDWDSMDWVWTSFWPSNKDMQSQNWHWSGQSSILNHHRATCGTRTSPWCTRIRWAFHFTRRPLKSKNVSKPK